MKQVIETTLYASPEALLKLLLRKRAWLFDADDTTWISERFAFQGCTMVANRYLSSFGRPDVQFTATELMNAYRGRNARAIFQQLAVDYRLPITDEKLASLVAEELDAAIAELSEHCVAAPGVVPVLQGLHRAEKVVAMVSSSALKRLHACLDKTKLWEFFPFIYSAVDSLPVPTSKPKPDIYIHSLRELGMDADVSVAFEDGKSGVESSVNAGIDVVGYVGLVPVEEQDAHARVLLDAGAKLVFRDWAADIQPVVDYLNGGM
jgi:HAD superfamily hydrolase (TIGR01509 family)